MAYASVDLHRIAADVAKIPDAGLYAAAKLVKKVADGEASKVGSPLAGKKKRAIKLRARDRDIRSVNGGRAILISGVPTGPWVWVTSGTRAHDIRRRKRGPMRKMTVRHPGTRGKRAWANVIDRAEGLVPRIFTDAVHEAVN